MSEQRAERWPSASPRQERMRTQATHRIAEWYELQLEKTVDKGGKSSPLEALRMTAAKGSARGRGGAAQTVRAKESRNTRGTIVPEIELNDGDRWLEFMMQQVNDVDPRNAYAAAVYAVEGTHEAAWAFIGCSDSTYFKYFNGAISTIILLEEQKKMGLLDGKWKG